MPDADPDVQPVAPGSGRFVAIHRTTDPIEARMVRDILRDEGIPARSIGTDHGAAIGVAQHILNLRVEVPEGDAERCRALVAEATQPLDLDDASLPDELRPHDDDEDEEGDTDAPDRRRVMALGASIVLPGGAHFYLRRPWTATTLIVGVFAALTVMRMTSDWPVFVASIVALSGLIVVDLIGGQVILGAVNRGRVASVTRQVLIGLVALGALAGGGYAVAPYVQRPELPEELHPTHAFDRRLGAGHLRANQGYNVVRPDLQLIDTVLELFGAE